MARVVLVTGAAGSIGSELCRQLAQMNIKKLIMFDSAESPLHNVRLEFEKNYPGLDFVPVIGDVRVKERLRMVFETYQPQIIFMPLPISMFINGRESLMKLCWFNVVALARLLIWQWNTEQKR